MESVQVGDRPILSEIRKPDCRHHWVIEQANGPTSLGRCKRCGSKREFFNDPDAVVRLPGQEEEKPAPASAKSK